MKLPFLSRRKTEPDKPKEKRRISWVKRESKPIVNPDQDRIQRVEDYEKRLNKPMKRRSYGR